MALRVDHDERRRARRDPEPVRDLAVGVEDHREVEAVPLREGLGHDRRRVARHTEQGDVRAHRLRAERLDEGRHAVGVGVFRAEREDEPAPLGEELRAEPRAVQGLALEARQQRLRGLGGLRSRKRERGPRHRGGEGDGRRGLCPAAMDPHQSSGNGSGDGRPAGRGLQGCSFTS
jgi:hypothetical protein